MILLSASGENPMAVGLGELIGQWLYDKFFIYIDRLLEGILAWFDSMLKFIRISFDIVPYLPSVVSVSMLCILCSMVVIFIIKLVSK